MAKWVLVVSVLCFSTAFGQFGFHFPQERDHIPSFGEVINFVPRAIDRGHKAIHNLGNRLRATQGPPSTEAPTTTTTTTTTKPSLWLSTTAPQQETVEERSWNIKQDDSCVAISGALGNCINIRRCQQYLVILQNAQKNPNAVDILRRSHCGFDGNDPKVCCPSSQPIPTVPPPFPTGPLKPLEPQTQPPEPQTPEPQTPEPPPPDSNVHMPDDGSDFVNSLPDPPECGFSNASFSRVVGGIPAKLGDFPWMALLGYHSQRFPGTARWLCGGTLVTKKHVLTAAHCLHGREDDLYIVRLGELDLSRQDDGATPTDVPIKKKIKHETYSAKSFTNDIAILVLVRSVQFTDLIRPICLPRTAELRALSFERYNPLIAGWGDTEFRGPAAPHLQVLQLPVVSNEFCANAYKAYKAQVIDERVLCAGYEEGGKDACQGDSGGPLMQPVYNRETYNTYFYQIGVVSFGRKCAEAGFPGVYSRTTHFIPWLYNQLVGSDQS